MTNRIKLFTESVSQMGIGMPEAIALTKLFKACLESALGVYDYDEDGNYWETDYSDDDLSEGQNTDTKQNETTETLDRMEQIDSSEREYADEEKFNGEESISHTGTVLTSAYMNYAPKLFDMKVCTFDDVSNMYKFIDWIINKFETFDSNGMFNNYTQSNNNKSYAAKMDRMLNALTSGPKVIQLLKDIKDRFSTELTNATIVNESTVSPLEAKINDFVTSMFSDGENGACATDDKLFTAYSLGYASQSSMEADADYASDLDEQARMAAEPDNLAKNYENNTKKKENDTLKFDPDCDVDDVDDEVEEFINVVPTFGLTDDQAVSLSKPSRRKNKDVIKQIAAKLDSLKKETRGGVVNATKIRKKASKTFDDIDL